MVSFDWWTGNNNVKALGLFPHISKILKEVYKLLKAHDQGYYNFPNYLIEHMGVETQLDKSQTPPKHFLGMATFLIKPLRFG